MQTPVKNAPGSQMLPFRKATFERVDILPAEAIATAGWGATVQRIERTIEGSGFVYGILLEAVAIAAGNAAAVAFTEDAPFAIFDTVVFRDVNGELVNLTGFDLFLANLVSGNYKSRYFDGATAGVTGNSLFAAVTGAGATGGSFITILRVPVSINRRSLAGALGNQDRGQKYSLRTDLAAVSATMYTVAPTTLPPINVNKYYENYAVPMPTGPNGQPQAIVPPSFGTLHFLTAVTSDTPPAGSSTVTHFIRRIGNTIRALIFVYRINGVRATIETAANSPLNLRLKIGEDTIFNETWRYRKARWFENYGFDAPNGVIAYDNIHDFGPFAATELGNDYWHTQAVANAQLQAQYPAGVGSTNNSLRIITDDMQLVGRLE
jgi:hypothetical protein